MIIQVTAIPVDQFFLDPLAIPVFEDVRPPHREAGNLDLRLGGLLSTWIADGTVDPGSATPTLFTASGRAFPLLVISGAGSFHELSAPSVERIIAGMTETLLRAKAPLFAIAARDFRNRLAPARDSAETILRGLAHGCDIAGVHAGHTIRIHWDSDQSDNLVLELRRFRFHLPPCREWDVRMAPEDEQWRQGPNPPETTEKIPGPRQ